VSKRGNQPPQPSAPPAETPLTRSQGAALDLSANRVISASAGTGKTHTLTELYIALLSGRLAPGGRFLQPDEWLAAARSGAARGMRPGQIVAVTFTKKAAADLLSRARERLEKEKHGSDLPQALQAHLQQCWEELPGAPVSTIDAFCARLLREAGARSPAPTAFAILEEDEADEMLDEALAGAASDWLAQQKDPRFGTLAREWDVLGDSGLVAIGRKLLSVLRTRGRTPDDAARRATAELSAADIHRRIGEWEQTLRTMPPVSKSKPKEELWQWFKEAAACSTPDDLRCVLLQLPGVFYGSRGEPLKWAETNKIAEPSPELLQALHVPFVKALAAYLSEALARYTRAKRAAGVVDFNDLLLYTRTLLKQGAGTGHYEFVLIDEFQDTNPLQDEVLRLVAFGTGGTKNVRLAVVGDRKQSIYRFRGADVSVMESAEKEPHFAVAPLKETLRHRDRVRGFINEFFAHVWPRDAAFHYDARHELEAAPHLQRAQWDGPAGELIALPDGEKTPAAEQHRWQQARAIAQRICCLIAPRENAALPRPRVWDKELRELRAPRLGDIAILARSVRHIRIPLQVALSQKNIPFRMLGGVSFYTRQEVLDVGNLLACVVHPGDDLSLAGLLRSPLAGLSDGGLWRLRMNDAGRTAGGSFHDRLRAAAEDPAALGFNVADAAALRQADALLQELRAGCGRRTAAELIDRACQATGFLGILALQPQGEVAVAAVRRVIELSRTFEARRVRHLSDFVRWLRDQAVAEWDQPGREGEADLEPDAPESGEAVKIGTVHSAKGLEFPIVIVADIGAQAPVLGGNALYHPGEGLGLKLGLEQEGLEAVGDAVYQNAREAEAEAERDERRRLLYVALTRARDYLVLLGETARHEKNEASNWRNLVGGFLAASPDALRKLEYQHPDLAAAVPGQPAALVSFDETDETGRPDAGSAPRLREDYANVAAAAPPALRGGTQDAGGLARRDLRVSVSALTRWLACPRRAALAPWLEGDTQAARADDEDDSQDAADAEAGESPDARALGTAAHAVLEAAFSGAACDVQQAWAQAAAQAGAPLDGPAADRASARVKALLDSVWGRAMLKLPPEQRLTEQAFHYRTIVDQPSGSVVTLCGKIDLLAAPRSGEWQVFDYKLAGGPAAGTGHDTYVRYAWQGVLYGVVAAQVLHVGTPLPAALVFLLDPQPHPVTPSELGFGGQAEQGILEKILGTFWRSQREPDPLRQEREVWLPAAPAAALRSRERCQADGCPHVQWCYEQRGADAPGAAKQRKQ